MAWGIRMRGGAGFQPAQREFPRQAGSLHHSLTPPIPQPATGTARRCRAARSAAERARGRECRSGSRLLRPRRRQKIYALQPLAALLHEARRVPAGEGGRIVEAVFALVGLGEHQRRRAGIASRSFCLALQLAQIADELHRVKVFVASPASTRGGIDQHQHAGTFGEERPDDGIRVADDRPLPAGPRRPGRA